MPRAPRLVLIEPGGIRREVVIANTPFKIGRQVGNDLLLRDSRISRQQAQIIAENGNYVLEDLGSRHGTFVNGQKVLRQTLKPKDNIDFGAPDSYRVIFLGEEATIEELLERVDSAKPAEGSSRELHHLGLLLEVARTLSSGLTLEDLLTTVVDAAIQVTKTERGVLMLKDSAGNLEMPVARDSGHGTIPPESLQISQSVLKQVMESRRELVVSDVGDTPDVGQQASIVRLQLRTVVALPLEKLPMVQSLESTVYAKQAELFGVLYLDSHKPSSAFSELDREVLRSLAREATTVIENARLFAASRAKERLDHELQIASGIQQQLLPKTFPELPHLEIVGSTLACQSIGGDFFDVIELGGGRCGFVVDDISGKGISAALLATLVQGVFFTTAALDIALTEVSRRVNKHLCDRSEDGRYATLFYGVLDPRGQFEYVNAGHVPPIIRRVDKTLEPLGSENFPVGMFPDATYSSSRVQLKQGDFLVMYTDGVTEAHNIRDEFYEERRLRQVLEEFSGETVQELAEAIHADLRQYTKGAAQADDITLVIVKYKGGA